jgi:uncharacterized protein YbjT (DUF2867 family)
VVAPSRRPLPGNAKLLNPVSPELEALLPNLSEWKADACVCATGTTRAKAGSSEAFRRVDLDLPLAFAKAVHAGGTETFALTSAMSASASSRLLYSRTKGELEQGIQEIGFKSLLIARPGLIGGHRQEVRRLERLSLVVFEALNPVLPRAARISPATRIAEVLLEATLAARPGVQIVSSAEFARP